MSKQNRVYQINQYCGFHKCLIGLKLQLNIRMKTRKCEKTLSLNFKKSLIAAPISDIIVFIRWRNYQLRFFLREERCMLHPGKHSGLLGLQKQSCMKATKRHSESSEENLFLSTQTLRSTQGDNSTTVSKSIMLLLVFVATCFFSEQAEAQTSIYVFGPDQSTVVKTGGFVGLHETYSISGQFRLTADLDSGVASFEKVDANLTDETGSLYDRSLDGIFNMTALAGTVIDDTTIEFEGKTAGGTGEPNNPYQIYTAEQMNIISTEPNDWDKHFELMEDIDLAGYIEKDFDIIGYWVDWSSPDNKPFTGVFDGNSHTISNFSYTSTDENCTGLFGYVTGVIKDLGLTDPNVDAGTGWHVGSLVGYLNNGTVINCYDQAGSVSGNGYVGGLVGYNYRGTITNCYSVTRVTGRSTVGGLIGSSCEGQVSSSFWDVETCGQITSAGGEGKTTSEMQTAGTYLNAGWDFVDETENGTEDIWWILEGRDYPRLWWELSD